MNLQPSQDYKSLWDVNYNGQQLTNTSDSTHVYLKKKGKKQNFSISSVTRNVIAEFNINSVVGGCIGYILHSSAQIIDISVVNNNLNSSGYYMYVSALIGTIDSNSSTNVIQMNNCYIQSINVWSVETFSSLGFVMQIQHPQITSITTSITKTFSTGISTINGVQINNCPNILATIINGVYVVPTNGC
ncbi:Hypothetical_protein [Hexamita inflata]|uniref:Hypothetical_protein n=1 Tax=Hexamita inflata TaxID=28002 RepID=A0AA86PI53_9EUKA|nr:Hypothetical protein HINF_LOCUS23950 [Hexamita inflata]